MDYTKLFYWLTVADNAKTFFGWGAFIFTVIFIIATICNGAMVASETEGESEYNSIGRKLARKWQFTSIWFMFLFWSLIIFTPSKRDALLIVAGGQTLNFLTTDETAKQIPHELSNFVLTELKNMASDAKIDLNIKDQKQKILDEAKKMSAEELLNKIQVDTTFANIILNK